MGIHHDTIQGSPKDDEKADITLTLSDANFVQLVMGKLNPQQVMRRESQGRGMMAQLTSYRLQHAGLPDAKAQDFGQHGHGHETAAYLGCRATEIQAMIPSLIFLLLTGPEKVGESITRRK